MELERKRLDDIADHSLYGAGANPHTIKYSFEIFKRYVNEGTLLELGPAEGHMTDLLAQLENVKLTVCEGSKKFCELVQAKHPTATVVHSLFENFTPTHKFNTIVLGHILEHVEDPVEILQNVKHWLAPDGIVLAAVPNADSIHRQAAVLMGLLESRDSPSKADIHHGHRRVYTPTEFHNDFTTAGLTVKKLGGYWLKPLSSKQIEETWDNQMLMAFMKLGEEYPEIAGEIYIVATGE